MTARADIHILYGIRGEERLEQDPLDVVENMIDRAGNLDSIRWPIRVHEFVQCTIKPKQIESLANNLLYQLLENLDAEYWLPSISCDITVPDTVMRKAALVFVKTVVDRYDIHLYGCSDKFVDITRKQVEQEIGSQDTEMEPGTEVGGKQ